MDKPLAHGVIARYKTAEDLVLAAQIARRAGYRNLDAFAPFPVPGLADALGFRARFIPLLAFMAGVLGAAAAFALQWYSAVIDYPYVVGGKPLASWPAFLPVIFEVGILAAVVTAVIAMLVANRLPQLYHPVFNDIEFDRASDDGFFLLVPCRFTAKAARVPIHELLQSTGACHVRELEP